MKSLVLLLTLSVFAGATLVDQKKSTPEEKQALLSKLARECSEELGFDFDVSMKLLLGNFSDRSEKAQCFMRCFFRKEGFFNEKDEPQNEFIVDSLIDSVSFGREKLAEIIDRCTKLPNDNACDASYKLLECFTTDDTVTGTAKSKNAV